MLGRALATGHHTAMRGSPSHLLFVAASLAALAYYASHWFVLSSPAHVVVKGAGVALLAAWAWHRAGGANRPLLVLALALGALGDILLETSGMVVGGIAFFAGHLVAIRLYWRNRRRTRWIAPALGLAVAATAYAFTRDPGVAVYAAAVGAMAGSALASRFALAGLGGLLFAGSDLLIFAQMGPLHGSPLPGLLIWPTYFVGQALIAYGVATAPPRETTRR